MISKERRDETICKIIADEIKDRPIEEWLVRSRRLKIAERILYALDLEEEPSDTVTLRKNASVTPAAENVTQAPTTADSDVEEGPLTAEETDAIVEDINSRVNLQPLPPPHYGVMVSTGKYVPSDTTADRSDDAAAEAAWRAAPARVAGCFRLWHEETDENKQMWRKIAMAAVAASPRESELVEAHKALEWALGIAASVVQMGDPGYEHAGGVFERLDKALAKHGGVD